MKLKTQSKVVEQEKIKTNYSIIRGIDGMKYVIFNGKIKRVENLDKHKGYILVKDTEMKTVKNLLRKKK